MPLRLKKRISRVPFARESILWLLRTTSRDVSMTNPWSGQKMRVNTYQHKNYWFYGKDRERSTMTLFSQYIRPGDVVVEVGAHIGFMSQLFSHLSGDEFESREVVGIA